MDPFSRGREKNSLEGVNFVVVGRADAGREEDQD